MTAVSPLTINIMLACYYAANPAEHVGVSWGSEAGRAVREWLEENELIGTDSKATERGGVWVDCICATPLPVRQWTIQERSAHSQDEERSDTDPSTREKGSMTP